MSAALVPELSVSDWGRSRRFYVDRLGFAVAYDRPEEGFSCLTRGEAELMIDQIGLGRTFGTPPAHPFGRSVNLQIEVPDLAPLLAALDGWPLFLPLEERWYRVGDQEAGQRQFVVADPDGYLLRFCQPIGLRPAQSGT